MEPIPELEFLRLRLQGGWAGLASYPRAAPHPNLQVLPAIHLFRLHGVTSPLPRSLVHRAGSLKPQARRLRDGKGDADIDVWIWMLVPSQFSEIGTLSTTGGILLYCKSKVMVVKIHKYRGCEMGHQDFLECWRFPECWPKRHSLWTSVL